MYNIGRLYRNGQGVSRNYTKAMEWYHKAAARSNDEAILNIGCLYEHGYGVPKNDNLAMKWFKKAILYGCPVPAKDMRDVSARLKDAKR